MTVITKTIPSDHHQCRAKQQFTEDLEIEIGLHLTFLPCKM
jgi:hypothetical protein